MSKINYNNLPYSKINYDSIPEIKKVLFQYSDTLKPEVINTVITTIKCAKKHKIPFNNIITIIDYSLPSNKKRLWIFDVREKQLLFHTYVSHGITSGAKESTHFSNKFNSKASSFGFYTTEMAYYGRHGLALRLYGRDLFFNDNAGRRAIVMHSAWYVNEKFVDKYGRIGRSWGCPAVPKKFVKEIVNTIKDESIFVIYYPSYQWYLKSKFLKCSNISSIQQAKKLKIISPTVLDDVHSEILYIDRNNNKSREESEPVLVIPAEDYKRIFSSEAPLERMLRRQFNNTEYIVLNHSELKSLDTNQDTIINGDDDHNLALIDFVIPVVKTHRGHYYGTVFKSVKPAAIKEIKLNSQVIDNNLQDKNVTIHYVTNMSNHLRSVDHFIRWIGL